MVRFIILNHGVHPMLKNGQLFSIMLSDDDLTWTDGKLAVQAVMVDGQPPQALAKKKLTLYLYPNLTM